MIGKEMNSIFSMTGFSTEKGTLFSRPMRVEMKSVNHRFLDLKIRIPREFSSIDPFIRAELSKNFSRGVIDLHFEWIDSLSAQETPQINFELAKFYFSEISKLGASLGISEKPSLSLILSQPEMYRKTSDKKEADQAWKEFEPILKKVLKGLKESREQEGTVLRKALLSIIHDLNANFAQIRERRNQSRDEQKVKIKERLAKIFEAHPLTTNDVNSFFESRVSQEAALLSERTDIEEEVVRFQKHLAELETTLIHGGSVGKKIEFILQELGREITTLGNKAQDYEISHTVVESKMKIEQFREQTLNLE